VNHAIQVGSRLFGPIEACADDCITLPDGMLGFAGERRFILLPAAAEGVFWLQAVEDGGLIFLLVDPFPMFPDYSVEVPDPVPGEPEPEIVVLSIVTLPRQPGDDCTANLQGPLVLDLVNRVGRQVIVADPQYHTRHPIDLRARLSARG
jgi:flagellar assembly factor FliW